MTTPIQLFQAHAAALRARARIQKGYRAGGKLRLQVCGLRGGEWHHLRWYEVTKVTRAELVQIVLDERVSSSATTRAYRWTLHLTRHNCADFGAVTADVTAALEQMVE